MSRSIDIYISTSGGAAGVFPYVQVLDLPYLMSDDRIAEDVMRSDFVRTVRKMALADSGNTIRLMTIGNLNELPGDARKGMEEGLEKTKNNSGINLILALSYGSRNEILRMVKNIANKAKNGDTDPNKIKEIDVNDKGDDIYFHGWNIK